MPIHLNLVKHQIQSKKLSIDAVADHANIDRSAARATLNGEIKPTPAGGSIRLPRGLD